MSEKILIFGKDAWPYTRAAREAFAKEGKKVDYFDVHSDSSKLDIMLKHSHGQRKVPVIVEGENVTIGFDGGTWGVWNFRLDAENVDTWNWLLVTGCGMQGLKAHGARLGAKDFLFSWLKNRLIIAIFYGLDSILQTEWCSICLFYLKYY